MGGGGRDKRTSWSDLVGVRQKNIEDMKKKIIRITRITIDRKHYGNHYRNHYRNHNKNLKLDIGDNK